MLPYIHADEYQDGYNAYLNNKACADNPYDNDSDRDLWRAWDNGYNAAAWDD